MKNAIFSLICLGLLLNTYGQGLTQTVRGKVYDEVTELPLIGATIRTIVGDEVIGAVADVNGAFVIPEVPIGRTSFKVTFVGYEEIIIPDVAVHSGKSVFLEVKMKESLGYLEEVVVQAENLKDLPLNEMAFVSARSFTTDETQRYAGGLDDPGRMASAFAGVTSTTLGENAIVIRGNAPKGVQWRMEGIEIPSPSHFAGATVTGGGFVTLLSNHVLANSDFLTGAFSADYGNALSGVFDMNMRTGNTSESERTFQAGMLGIDFAAEGPFNAKGNSSYLFNYRYSTLGLIEPVLPEETNTIRYQDLSFNFHFDTEKQGSFSFWGIGGKDYGRKNEELLLSRDRWEMEDDRQDYEYGFLVGATGVQHKLNIGSRSLLKTSIAASVNDAFWDVERIDDELNLVPDTEVDNLTGQYSLSSVLNHKFSPKQTVQTGIILHRHQYNITIQESPENLPPLATIVDEKGSSYRTQVFAQSRTRLGRQLTLNTGLHSQHFRLNRQTTLEPRLGIKYALDYNNTVGIGYGNHSQMEDLKIYLIQDPAGNLVNKDLRLTRAHHLVFSYDRILGEDVRLKVEPYYQFLYDVPVAPDSSFSMVNFSQDWFLTQDLVNDGKGRNYGIDLTLERFLRNNFYYLVTGSIFKSEYQGGDGVWRNSRYDRGFAFNFLAGKEWQFGTDGSKWFGLNGRLNLMGGLRYSPVDDAASIAAEEVIFDETNAFQDQAPTVNYLDMTITYRKNKRNFSTVWSLQVKNLLGYEDFDGYNYNFSEMAVEESRSIVMIPNLSYKIEF